MSETAATQLRRILHLVPRIGDGRERSLEQLARSEGVSRNALLGDLQAIATRLDEPGGFVDPVQITIEPARDRVSVFTAHFLRPMRLTRRELRALDLGLAMVRAERPDHDRAAVDSARARLRAVISRLPADDAEDAEDAGIHADAAAAGDTTHLAMLRDARAGRRRVRLDYRKGDADAAEARVVHPYALVASRGAWYVVAHCERSRGLRVFRLDRVEGVALTDGSYEIPAGFSLDAVLGDGRMLLAEAAEPLRVRYSARIRRWIEERHAGVAEPDGSYVVEHPLADTEWAVRHVLQYGPDAEVLAPAAVRARVVERLREISGRGPS